MKEISKILVVSRSTKHCRQAVHFGISLARLYRAKLHVLHVVHDPFNLDGWNLPVPAFHDEYEALMKKYRRQLHQIIEDEKGQDIIELVEEVRDGEPVEEITNTVKSEGIDLLIMLGHEEGRLEHFLFGRTNHAVCRKLPCSILLVKQEPSTYRED